MSEEKKDAIILLDKLEDVFSRVNEWLKYGDQKLAGLIVLNGGILWGYTRYISTKIGISYLVDNINLLGYALIISSLFICIAGMFPVLSKFHYLNTEKSDLDNVLYFKDIFKYDRYEYLKFISKKLNLTISSFSAYEEDISQQITCNAKIATVKLQRTQFASWLTLSGSTLLISACLIIIYQG